MTKITIQPSCENAPRKSFLKDFNVAFATGNAGFIIDQVHEDITWVIHGDKMIRGKDQFAQEVRTPRELWWMSTYITPHTDISTQCSTS